MRIEKSVQRRKMSIRNKVLSIVAFLIIFPLIIVGLTSYQKSVNVLIENSQEQNMALNSEIGEMLKSEFGGYMNGINAISVNVDATDILEKPEYEPFFTWVV